MKKTIKQECDSCGGSGLYCGFMEPKGTAVVCVTCSGRGWYEYDYKEFEHRRRKQGIKTISYSRGSFIGTGVGAIGKQMTYAEFEKEIPA